MVNAHTLTKVFRDGQFDIHSFLGALQDISKADTNYAVEVKWSDGSIDIIPVFDVIRSITSNEFSSADINERKLEVITSDNSLSIDSGISLLLDTVNKDVLTMSYCSIGKISALSISIDDSDAIIVLGSKGFEQIDTDALQTENFSIYGCTYDNVIVNNDIDLSGHVIDARITPMNTIEYDQILVRQPTNVVTSIQFTRPLCFCTDNYKSYIQSKLNPNGYMYTAVRVPCIGSSNAYSITKGEPLTDIDAKINPKSLLGLLCLYPNSYCTLESTSDSNTFVLTIDTIPEDYNYSVIQVRNTSDTSINACNVWNIVCKSPDSAPVITAMNYVDIPPYSCIDFMLLVNEYSSTFTRVVKMLPMKNL